MLSLHAFAENNGTPREIFLPVDQVFIQGTDHNDEFAIALNGYLPNLCHEEPMIEIDAIKNTVYIDVKTLTYDPSNPFCPEVLKEFIQKINLGKLEAGSYQIVINEHTDFEQNIQIFIEQ